jgi:hypothetical protein
MFSKIFSPKFLWKVMKNWRSFCQVQGSFSNLNSRYVNIFSKMRYGSYSKFSLQCFSVSHSTLDAHFSLWTGQTESESEERKQILCQSVPSYSERNWSCGILFTYYSLGSHSTDDKEGSGTTWTVRDLHFQRDKNRKWSETDKSWNQIISTFSSSSSFWIILVLHIHYHHLEFVFILCFFSFS